MTMLPEFTEEERLSANAALLAHGMVAPHGPLPPNTMRLLWAAAVHGESTSHVALLWLVEALAARCARLEREKTIAEHAVAALNANPAVDYRAVLAPFGRYTERTTTAICRETTWLRFSDGSRASGCDGEPWYVAGTEPWRRKKGGER